MSETGRSAAARLLYRIDRENAYSNLVLRRHLGSYGLNARDQALCCTLVYGVLERRITLDYVIASHSKLRLSEIDPLTLDCLRIGAYQLLYLDRIPASAAINESVRTVKMLGGVKSAGFVNAVLHAIDRDGKNIQYPPEKNRKTHLSIKYSCPQWIVRLWLSAYGAEHTEQLLQAAFGRPPLTIRVNTTRVTPDELAQKLAAEGIQTQPHPYLPDALNISDTGALETQASYQEGLFHVQDAASQLCVKLLDPQPGERVADVCAAPGGKTFTIAQRMQNTGRVDSFDLYPQRTELIAQGAQRLGLSIVQARVRDAATGDVSEKYDRVLCDVPCSGLGILRRKPEIRYKSRETLDNLPDLQYSIIMNTCALVAPGGVLVYSTCALNPAENREVADRFLASHPEFEPMPIAPGLPRFGEEPAHQLTLMPHLHDTDGFFIAAFHRKTE